MHPNTAFRHSGRDRNVEFARARGFGTLAINGPHGPLLSHVPFYLGEAAEVAELHLLRSNPILRALAEPVPAVLAVQGPDGYVSPDWYGIDDQVPTWNYVAVHLRGTLHRAPQEDLRAMLDRLSEQFESRLAPKPPWRSDKMTPELLTRMMRSIVPCRLEIAKVDGTWKLNQNKPDAARLSAADNIATGAGLALADLAALMREAGD